MGILLMVKATNNEKLLYYPPQLLSKSLSCCLFKGDDRGRRTVRIESSECVQGVCMGRKGGGVWSLRLTKRLIGVY